MMISDLKCLDVENGFYENPYTGFFFILENKQFKIGKFKGKIVSCYIYDLTDEDGTEFGVLLPDFSEEIIRIGEL